MKKIKIYLNEIILVVFCLLTLVYSQYSYAGVINIPIELQCSKNPMVSPWVTIIPGQLEAKYTITTTGLFEESKHNVEEVINIEELSKTKDGLYVYVGANCIPSDEVTNIALTGSSLTCEKGQGIQLRMLEPNDINPDTYRYIGVLKIDKTEEDLQKLNVIRGKEIQKQQNSSLSTTPVVMKQSMISNVEIYSK